MARIHRAPGACPACDQPAPRTVGITGEVYHCPLHGRLDYSPGRIPLEALGHTVRDIGFMRFAQPMTGLPMVH